MTNREREILKLIEENPMITQEEIAKRLFISRAAVATHIHNLVNKGYIRGRGYVLNSKSQITVIGGINMDIIGICNKQILKNTSNPGHVEHYLGGVGRNTALALTKLGMSCSFISAYGEDIYGELFRNDARENGMNIELCQQLKDYSTSTYLYIEDQIQDYTLGIDDMEIIQTISPQFIEKYLPRINQSQYCILDNSLRQDTIEYLANSCQIPLLVNSASVNKMERLIHILDQIEVLVAQPQDIFELFNILNYDDLSLEESLKILNKKIPHTIIHSPEKGIIYSSKNKQIKMHYEFKTDFNSNGTSSVIMATVNWGLFYNYPWKEIINYTIKAIRSSLETNESIHPLFNENVLLK
ncbi:MULTISPECIES: PfkB family carbohydrate kinase [Aerococcus]|uniref:Winged helix-turn-helix transcriptional regulator n=1 Tax=Aerococcus sanguinicola TaxID=119206 RepID=A0A5N1GH57_9LACT|nr:MULTISPECIES: PfkB family carbohydrate kinase [Aerococcus]KAA9300132.1 winged helix-turn-helix transcriptional regulator [Aerococcus sanguinicola]MDK6369474.1 PfkB family carbohydrate kinase [Aerococcus sp. UMB9870]MDK6679961.1 PfkB family carbohydrate kinase [Aerococcus sp. UMB8608]MDK6686157.1 PfkB family carbohydrate kinase [Aerococcus sp. UMB8623]MDK6939937.1 PfkB family carbohydrate kinase [Aerococcus sp. UMB8487]